MNYLYKNAVTELNRLSEIYAKGGLHTSEPLEKAILDVIDFGCFDGEHICETNFFLEWTIEDDELVEISFSCGDDVTIFMGTIESKIELMIQETKAIAAEYYRDENMGR